MSIFFLKILISPRKKRQRFLPAALPAYTKMISISTIFPAQALMLFRRCPHSKAFSSFGRSACPVAVACPL